MKCVGFAVAFLAVLASIANGQNTSGTYTTLYAGRALKTENYTVSVREDGNIKVEADTSMSGVHAQRISMILTSAYKPISYSQEVNGAVLSAELSGSSARLRLAGQPDRTVSTDATAIFENVVWSPFIVLLRQYDTSKGGSQSFRAFSPSDGRTLSVRIERTNAPEAGAARQTADREYYVIVLGEKVEIDVWTDRDRTPLVFSIPSQSISVVRNGSEALADLVLKTAAAQEGQGSFTAEEVTFKNGDVQLSGTLTIPKAGKGPFPAVVLITGSGPQDRDNNPGGFSMFRLIAEKLSSNGVAVLRHDDRGFGKSSNPTEPTTYRVLMNDTKAAVDYLRSRKDIDPDRIALIGHSEGVETAGILAEEDKRIAAIGLLGGVSRPLDVVLLEQVWYDEALQRTVDPAAPNELPELVRTLLKQVDAAKDGKPDRSAADLNEYYRQHAAHDPLATIRKVKCPILILQGERDENALAYNGVALALAAAQSGNKHVRLRVFPNLEHSFVASSRDKRGTVEERGHISQEVLETLGKWAVSTLVLRKETEPRN
jgi:dipeptidyl aminopeptidase/acylaminoacyl peptidase